MDVDERARSGTIEHKCARTSTSAHESEKCSPSSPSFAVGLGATTDRPAREPHRRPRIHDQLRVGSAEVPEKRSASRVQLLLSVPSPSGSVTIVPHGAGGGGSNGAVEEMVVDEVQGCWGRGALNGAGYLYLFDR